MDFVNECYTVVLSCFYNSFSFLINEPEYRFEKIRKLSDLSECAEISTISYDNKKDEFELV